MGQIFYYINQPWVGQIQGLNWIGLDCEISSDWPKKMNAGGISIDAYPFLAFSDLTCHLQDTGIGVFWLNCAA